MPIVLVGVTVFFRLSISPPGILNRIHSTVITNLLALGVEPIKGSPGGNKLISTWLASSYVIQSQLNSHLR